MIKPRYAYNYAICQRKYGNMCTEVRTSTLNQDEAGNDNYIYVRIPTYDNSYIFKYYNEENKKWYLDADFQEEWTPPSA